MNDKATNKSQKAKVIGLTGNIACGKSSVAKILAEMGIPVVDADQVARDASKPGSKVFPQIISLMSESVKDASGALDRLKIRELIFNDPDKRKKLEAILHPEISRLSKLAIEAAKKKGFKLIIYEASLLFEAGRTDEFDGILLVVCKPELQLKRLIARQPELTKEMALKIIQSQMPQGEKMKRATWSIDNSGDAKDLRKETLFWLSSLK